MLPFSWPHAGLAFGLHRVRFLDSYLLVKFWSHQVSFELSAGDNLHVHNRCACKENDGSFRTIRGTGQTNIISHVRFATKCMNRGAEFWLWYNIWAPGSTWSVSTRRNSSTTDGLQRIVQKIVWPWRC